MVPADLGAANAPIGRLHRGYGSSPRTVAAKASAFVRGMDRAGIATAVKHFPGLGRVRGNTDYARRVVDRQTTRDGADVAAFGTVIDAGVDMVMVSSAYYEQIDPERRAAFSPVVLTDLLREDLGFTGVVISDDLAAAAMADVDPPQRALRFLGAGGDLMIIGDPGLVARMARRGAAADDRRRAVRRAGPAERHPGGRPEGAARTRHLRRVGGATVVVSGTDCRSTRPNERYSVTFSWPIRSRAGWTSSGEVSGIEA